MIYNTAEELRHKVCEKVYEVYEVFKNFFGEDFTDLQNLPNPVECLPDGVTLENLGSTDITDRSIRDFINSRSDFPFILVYWPRVTVTNEHDKSVEIQELYAKIEINLAGRIPYECRGFRLNRSRYSLVQFTHGYNRGYMHSHVCEIPKDDLSVFQNPCLGSGPINSTIGTLKNQYDEITWMLFCQELAMYVTVESLTGIPYNKLEELGQSTALPRYNGYFTPSKYDVESHLRLFNDDLPEGTLKAFVAYYLEHGHLNFCYKDGRYEVGMSFYEFIIDISNAFIDYFNSNLSELNTERLFADNILIKAVVSDGKFYCNNRTTNTENVHDYIGRHVLWFKGRDITLTIDESEEFNPIITTVLDSTIAMHILINILIVINYRYKNEHNSQNRGTEAATTYQNVSYL